MAKITVKLNAFYGYSCGFQSHGSSSTEEIEISDEEFEALRKFGEGEITAEDVVDAINRGNTTLESLHEQLEEKFYYMVEEYWLYEADNECKADYIYHSFLDDVEDGTYDIVPLDRVIEWWESAGNVSLDDDEMEFLSDFDTCYIDCEEELQAKYEKYIQDKYFDWLKQQDHEFVAKRVGLDLDACRDDEVDYTILLSK